MEYNEKMFNSTNFSYFPYSTTSSTSSSYVPISSTPPSVNPSPCAACKNLRRKCDENCVLAPYFPPSEPVKFTVAHRIFGASNIIKLLRELPESHRADAVSSMVYEANARLRDPIYGCTGAIYHLQKQISELQTELAKAKSDIVNIQCQQQSNLISSICMDLPQTDQDQSIFWQQPYENLGYFFDNNV